MVSIGRERGGQNRNCNSLRCEVFARASPRANFRTGDIELLHVYVKLCARSFREGSTALHEAKTFRGDSKFSVA